MALGLSNPLTPERLNKLKDDATDLLKKFSLLYIKNYGSVVYEKISAELTGGKAEDDEFKLKYRPHDDPARSKRTDLHSCECFVVKGEGPGTFTSWKKAFAAEQEDNSINIYTDEQARKAGKQPMYVIRPAGYKAVSKVSEYYAGVLRDMAGDLGLTEAEVTSMTNFSSYSWALAHPQRASYIFQLHKPKSGSCGCLRRGAAVEPDEAAYERRDDLLKYFNWMKACVKRSDDECDSTEETSRKAFRSTCKQLPDKVDSLKGWSDNGTETEILVDMLIEALVPSLREAILEELKGPASVKLATWNKIVVEITRTLVAIVDPAWEAMQKQAKELEPKVEQAVRPAIAMILDIKASVEEKIRERSGKDFDSGLVSHVTPFIKPLIDAFETPLKKGFDLERELLETKLQLQLMPNDNEECRDYLNHFAKTTEMKDIVEQRTQELVAPLEALKVLSPDTFQDVDTEELQSQAGELLLKTLDAVVYTLCLHLDKRTPLDDELFHKLMMDYDHDVVIQRCHFVKEVAGKILLPAFQKRVAPIISKVTDALNNVIPAEMQDFLNVENIFDKLIEKLVTLAIDKVVSAAFSLP